MFSYFEGTQNITCFVLVNRKPALTADYELDMSVYYKQMLFDWVTFDSKGIGINSTNTNFNI